MKALALALISLAVHPAARADELVFGETRAGFGTHCVVPSPLSREEIERDNESSARQICDAGPVEKSLEPVTEAHHVDVCLEGAGGARVHQTVYRCKERTNPDALFEGGSSMLRSRTNEHNIGLVFMMRPCQRFELTGLTHRDTTALMHTNDSPLQRLEKLRDALKISINRADDVREGKILDGTTPAIEYQTFPQGGRSAQLQIRNRTPTESIDALLARVLGRSPVTDYRYGIKIVPSDCSR